MLTSDDIIKDFERNRRIVHSQCEGLTTEDSLIQPPGGGNCLNWTVGHLVVHRDKILHAMGAEGVLDEATFQRYTNESDPVTGDGPDIRSLDDLLEALDETQTRIGAAVPLADFDAPFDHERFKTVGERVRFYYFHDTYHTGQTELLRSLAGRTDKVI
ncbi:MAG: DinB family protein [Acidimicrobiia bacterium]